MNPDEIDPKMLAMILQQMQQQGGMPQVLGAQGMPPQQQVGAMGMPSMGAPTGMPGMMPGQMPPSYRP